ncbi:hypothetical protein [Occallatibacter riparius]|uniref:Uncharacterized protein n=1 Tax=Occallatibacter riparius TaxID=1002689 RepID=A0A9J7BLX4_9BACT|nr:hypothetical protein [Occallatibacter riparius]UWZ82770.1 hypothetical protein MOP44_19625 [Occallatibacter riparius]
MGHNYKSEYERRREVQARAIRQARHLDLKIVEAVLTRTEKSLQGSFERLKRSDQVLQQYWASVGGPPLK